MRAIEDFTGFPEIMDGRVKTLHPRLYAGLLARRDDDEHLRAAAEQAIEPVDLVCVNLYPFEQTLARGDADDAGDRREHRHRRPDDDPRGRQEQRVRGGGGRPGGLRAACSRSCASPTGGSRCDTRTRLAAKAFALHRALRRRDLDVVRARARYEGFPPHWRDAYEKVTDLRYGENPHQRAAFYARVGAPTHLLDGVTQLHGKELSFNNLLDLSSARELVEEFDDAGVRDRQAQQPVRLRASARRAQDAYERAFACDPQSAYGGVIALNRPRRSRLRASAVRAVHRGAARARASTPTRSSVLQEKKNVRLLELRDWPAPSARGRRQAGDRRPARADARRRHRDARADARDERQREPSEAQWEDLLFAWRVCRHVRSNAIVIARGRRHDRHRRRAR